MASERQILANRQNAAKSTGPKTPEGMKAVRHNALKHGVLSKDVLVSDEDGEEFAGFAAGLRARLGPDGELEGLLVDRVVSSAWRLRRVMRVEVELFDGERSGYGGGSKGVGNTFMLSSLGHNGDVFSKLSRYETAIERGMFRALHELQRLQAARRGEEVAPPVAVDVDVSGLPGGDGPAG